MGHLARKIFFVMIAAASCVAAIVAAAGAEAQVTSLDSNYTSSLLAHGLNLPWAGGIYRPATNDVLFDQENSPQIVRIDANTGAVNTFANVPAGIHGDQGTYVWQLAVNSKGEVFATVYASGGPVLRFDSSGNFLGSFPITQYGEGGMAFDKNDNLYIAEGADGNSAHTIYEYPAGNYTTPSVFASGFGSILGLAFNSSGQLFASDFTAGVVYQVTPGGTTASSHIVWASGIGQVTPIAINPLDQSVFVGVTYGNKVIRISSPGQFSTFASGFSTPEALGFDTAGNFYAGDDTVGAIWKFTRITSTATISPTHGGNAGSVTVRITGQGLQDGATVTLSGSGPDIVGTNTSLLSPGVLQSTFDLTQAQPGVRSVTITNPDRASVTVASGFTVEEGGEPELSVQIIGLDRIRIGSTQTYYLSLINSGSIDAPFVEADVPDSVSAITQSDLGSNVRRAALASGSSLLQPVLATIGANSSALWPFEMTGKVGSCPVVSGNARRIKPDDPCDKLESAKQAADNYLTLLYERRVANLDVWMFAVLPVSQHGNGLCFNIANRASATFCNKYETEDESIENAIKAAENAANFVCVLEAANNCPVSCGDINIVDDLLGGLANSLKMTLLDMKNAFSDTTINASRVGSDDANIATLLNQLQSLPASPTFSDVSAPPFSSYPADNATTFTFCPVSSLDPNDLVGNSGVGRNRWVPAGQNLTYATYFTNEQGATASAQAVTVSDQLDLSKLDLRTVTLLAVSFGSNQIELPNVPLASQPVDVSIDLRPTTPLIVEVTGKIDTVGGNLLVRFTTLDPSTGEPITDPTLGFLNPGMQGSVLFEAAPKAGLPTGTVVSNSASITFDANSPILTPTWSNDLDGSSPTSHVNPLPSTEVENVFNVSWSGSDVGAGVQDYTVFVSDNAGPFSPWLTNTTATQSTYVGNPDHTYSFYSIARDLVGNVEPAKADAEATTRIVGPNLPVPPIPPTTPTPPLAPTMPTAPIAPAPPSTPSAPVSPITPTYPAAPIMPASPIRPAVPAAPSTPAAPIPPSESA